MWNVDLDDFLWDGSIKELNFLEWGKGWDFFLDEKGGGMSKNKWISTPPRWLKLDWLFWVLRHIGTIPAM